MRTLTKKIIKDMPNNNIETNGWSTWAKYVLKSLEELSDYNKKIDRKVEENKDEYITALNTFKIEVIEQIGSLKSEIGIIKTKTAMKSGLIGAMTAAMPSLVYVIFKIIEQV